MVHGPTSEKKMKDKELEEAKKKAEDDYQGGGAYRAFLELFYKNKLEEDKKNGSREGYVTLTYAYVYSCTRPVGLRVQLLPSYLSSK